MNEEGMENKLSRKKKKEKEKRFLLQWEILQTLIISKLGKKQDYSIIDGVRNVKVKKDDAREKRIL